MSFMSYWEGKGINILVISYSIACIHRCSLNLKSGAFGLKKLTFTFTDWWEEYLIIEILTCSDTERHFTDIGLINNRSWHQNCSKAPVPYKDNFKICVHIALQCVQVLSLYTTRGMTVACPWERWVLAQTLPIYVRPRALLKSCFPACPCDFLPEPGFISLCWISAATLLGLASHGCFMFYLDTLLTIALKPQPCQGNYCKLLCFFRPQKAQLLWKRTENNEIGWDRMGKMPHRAQTLM